MLLCVIEVTDLLAYACCKSMMAYYEYKVKNFSESCLNYVRKTKK
jgi:hypothetical protein